MTIKYNSNVPTLIELHNAIKEALGNKYECSIVHDRWTLNFKGAQCVLVKKTGMLGICVAPNEKKQIVDVDGIVPNQVLDKVVFGNFVTRLLLVAPWNKLEQEVASAIRAKLS